jgi:hypothetical protein
MNTQARIKPVELSRQCVDSKTVQTKYKAGYGFVTVNSNFTGKKELPDLFFEILLNSHEKNEKNSCRERHDI